MMSKKQLRLTERQRQLTIDAAMTSLKAAQDAALTYLHDEEYDTMNLYLADVVEFIEMIIKLQKM